jgi:polyisoprenoid-binding protein YceI
MGRAMRCGLLALALLPGLCATPAAAQTLVAEGSEIRFVTRQMGVPVEGRFTRFGAELKFDPKQPQSAQIGLNVDMRSLSFAAAETEVEAAKAEWLDSARHTSAVFRSNTVKALGADRFEVVGTLQIKGVAREVTVPVSLVGSGGGRAVASGSFVIERLGFGIGGGAWGDPSLVANAVQVRFRFNLAGLP